MKKFLIPLAVATFLASAPARADNNFVTFWGTVLATSTNNQRGTAQTQNAENRKAVNRVLLGVLVVGFVVVWVYVFYGRPSSWGKRD